MTTYEADDSDLDDNVLGADIICLPPHDGEDTDKDDAPSDDEVVTNRPRQLGKGVLAMPPEIELRRSDGAVALFSDPISTG